MTLSPGGDRCCEVALWVEVNLESILDVITLILSLTLSMGFLWAVYMDFLKSITALFKDYSSFPGVY